MPQQLQTGSILQNGKYRVIRALGQGGFGITYLAEQTLMDRKVCIKEFFVKEYCDRDEDTSHVTLGTSSNADLMQRYMTKFIKEARTIAKMNHPNIVRIHDVFNENNTAYIVMDYLAGSSLAEYIKQYGPLTEDIAISYIEQIGNALSFAHSHNVMHLDVKPSNIMLDNEKKRVVLIDFGLSKQYTEAGEQTSSTPVGLSQGYAPLEQYQAGGVKEFSPSTDIYSLGATLYTLLSGRIPPSASDVNEDGLPEILGISGKTMSAIRAAMQPRRKVRPQSVDSFLMLLKQKADKTIDSGLHSTENETTIIVPQKNDNNQKSSESRRKKPLLFAIAGAVLTAALVFLLIPKSSNTSKANIDLEASIVADIPVEKDTDIVVSKKVSPNEVSSNKNVTTIGVNPNEKPVKGALGKTTTKLNGMSLSTTSIELLEGERYMLEVEFIPLDATGINVEWKSTNENVATVSKDGEIYAIREGSSAIVCSASGVKDVYCNVTVKSKSIPTEKQQTDVTQPPITQQQAPVQKQTQPTEPVADSGIINGHQWVNLGLSVKWATTNVGAASDSEFGSYFAWGEVTPKSTYDWSNLKYCLDGNGNSFSKYVTSPDYGDIDNKIRLELSDDAARHNWGGSWRTPTEAEVDELVNKCQWRWGIRNGNNGYYVTGPNGNMIFLPAAGYKHGRKMDAGGNSAYLTSNIIPSNNQGSFILYFDTKSKFKSYGFGRFLGQSVRPVTE